ncbi:MAG TPA: UDP-N-acetylmuramate dehydrogenase [Candidatus Saccharimonadales bacterium]|nr:UDP-N-acetylmuramate dehydrogenase [Candidatus Saccharimonadales bacterium]
MQIQTDVSLKDYSTMRLGGNAAHLTLVSSESELIEAIEWAQSRSLPVIMIGGGSNVLWRDEGFPGLVLVNRIPGFTIEDKGNNRFHVTTGAGENWDAVIARTTAEGLTGIENLSLIPGTVGATPIQNVGAYYQDISDTLVQVTAYDLQKKAMVTLTKAECELAYRTSRFKSKDHGRFFITSVTFHLEKRDPEPPFYPSLQQYLDDHNITSFTPEVIRQAVIAVRSAKLPDPAKVANNGSFFANPMITQEKLNELQETYGNVMHWPVGENVYKIPAAWLVQEAGFKGVHDKETGMATWPTQAIVLVNEHAKTTADALAFKQKILDAVQKQFGITLEQEPVVL